MTKNIKEKHSCECSPKVKGGATEGIYGLAFLGALLYFIQNATSISEGGLGILKAIFWPAYLVYQVLTFIGA